MERKAEEEAFSPHAFPAEVCACSCYLPGCASLAKSLAETARQEKLQTAQCPICLDVLYEPVTITCGHTFCAGCLLKVAGKRCPFCRAPFLEYPKINFFICNWLNKELQEEVGRKRDELLRELCREVAESGCKTLGSAPWSPAQEPIFDNERLMRECTRREEQRRRHTMRPNLPTHDPTLISQESHSQRGRIIAQAQQEIREAIAGMDWSGTECF